MKHKISVCIIAKNEELNIKNCIDSVKSIAYEVIVTDTGSSDNTKAIAEELDCKVYDYRWNNDFASARNYCKSFAKGDYILSIDADEVLVNPVLIEEVLEKSTDSIAGWNIQIISYNNEQNEQMQYISSNVRLFKNNPEFEYVGKIHEQISNSILKNNYKIQISDINILHFGYDLSKEELKQKNQRNLNILNDELVNDKFNSQLLYSRAKTLIALGEIKKAELDIHSIMAIRPTNKYITAQAINLLIAINLKTGKVSDAIIKARESLNIYPQQVYPNLLLADVYFSAKKYEDALVHYKNILELNLNKENSYSILGDIHIPVDDVLNKLAMCLINMRNYTKAKELIKNAIAINSQNYKLYLSLAKIYYETKDYRSALTNLKQAQELAQDSQKISDLIAQTQKKIDENQNSVLDDYPTLSLCMIVKDEESNIAKCLDSIKDIVDEIIIVDTGSADSTIEIAQKYGAKIYNYKWNNDFSAARNESIRYATKDWILYLDADETLSAESSKFIKTLLKNAKNDIGGFLVTIESKHSKLEGGSEIHRGAYPRIFRNYGYPKIKFIGRVHEQISPALNDLGKNVAHTDVVIYHYGYDQSPEVMQDKIKRNYNLLLQHVNEEPTNGYAWFQLGQTLGLMQLKKESEDAIKFAIKCDDLSESIYASACATLSQLIGNSKRFEEALYWAEESIKAVPEQIFAPHLKAFLLYYLGRYQESEQLFIELINKKQSMQVSPRTGFEVEIPISILYEGLAKARKKLN